MAQKQGVKRHGGDRKYGRNKRAKDETMSAYVRGKIDFASYWKRIHGINFTGITVNLK